MPVNVNLITIIIIAISLSMDAFAVSVVSGAVYKQLRVKHIFRMAFFFGFFQAFMPLVGYLTALSFKELIADFDHWIVFSILTAIGFKMIYESFKMAAVEKNYTVSNLAVLLILSVATSIDALAVGITLSLITDNIVTALVVIGIVTFILTCFGAVLGKKFGHFFEAKIEAVGGLVLIGLGVKILLGHLFF